MKGRDVLEYILKFDKIIAACIIAAAILFAANEVKEGNFIHQCRNSIVGSNTNSSNYEMEQYYRELRYLISELKSYEKDRTFYEDLKDKQFFNNAD